MTTFPKSTVVGSSSTKKIAVTNNTSVDVKVTPGPITGSASSLFAIDQSASFTLPAMGTTQLSVSYQPLAPSAQDAVGIDLALSLGGSVHLTLEGTALQNGLSLTPIPMNFGFVQPGDLLSLPLRLANIGNEPITVTSAVISNPGSPPVFAIAQGSFSGGSLMPGEGADVTVTFSPRQFAQFSGELDVSSTDSLQAVPVALEGFGGGAAISCSPAAVDFGTVAANAQTSLLVTCTNTGSDVSGHPEAGLSLTALRSSNGAFVAQIDPGSPSQPVPAHQSVLIDVGLRPTSGR
jgi:hypothetical protein